MISLVIIKTLQAENECSGENPYNENGECVSECSLQYPVINEQKKTCSDQCGEGQGYVQEGACAQNCDSGIQFLYVTSSGLKVCLSTSCNEDYPYAVQDPSDGPKECVQSCQKAGIYNLTNTHTTPKQCVSDCTTTDYQFVQNGYCEQECTDTYAYPMSESDSNICSDTCAFRVDSNNNNSKYCVSDGKQCPIGEQYQYVLDTQDGRDQCVNYTSYYVQLDDGRKLALNSCDNDYPFTVIDNKRPIQCTDDCSKVAIYNYVQVDQCVKQCYGDYAQPQTGYICDDNCQFHINNGYRYCDQECDEQYPFFVEQGEVDQCVSNCSQVLLLNYSQGYVCVSGCTEDYAYPIDNQDNICSNTCDYYYDTTEQRNQCVSDCPENYDYYVYHEQQRYECVQNCQDSQYTYLNGTRNICTDTCQNINIGDVTYQYEQNGQCVVQCMEEYAYPESGNTCDNTCMYQTINNSKYCTQELNSTVRRYCVEDCSQQQEYNLEYIDEQNIKYCLTSCPDGYRDQDGQCVVYNVNLGVVVGIPIAAIVLIVVVILVIIIASQRFCCRKKKFIEDIVIEIEQ